MNKHLGAVSGQAQGNRAAEARRRTRHQRLVIPQVAITPVVPFQAVMRGQGEWCRCLLRPIQRIADPRIDPGELASVSDSSGRSPHRLLTPIRQSAPTFDRRLTGSLRSATAAYHTSPSSRSQRRVRRRPPLPADKPSAPASTAVLAGSCAPGKALRRDRALIGGDVSSLRSSIPPSSRSWSAPFRFHQLAGPRWEHYRPCRR